MPDETAPVFTLRQTRAFTARECRVLYSLWRRLRWPQGAGFAYTAATYLFYGFAGFLAFSILLAASRLADSWPSLAARLIVAALGFIACYVVVAWRQSRFSREYYFQSYKPGNPIRLDADGLHLGGDLWSVRFLWPAITAIHSTKSWLVVLMATNSAVLLAKDAFADQDVEAFCAELTHRWHAGCAAAKGAVA